jgi:hypothetical protein
MVNEQELESVKARLSELQATHRSLDRLIGHADGNQAEDDLELRRLKKQKLKIKDQISVLERQLVPDIRA